MMVPCHGNLHAVNPEVFPKGYGSAAFLEHNLMQYHFLPTYTPSGQYRLHTVS